MSYSNVDDPLDGYKFKSALPFKIFSTLSSESEWTLFNSVRLLGYAVCFSDRNSVRIPIPIATCKILTGKVENHQIGGFINTYHQVSLCVWCFSTFPVRILQTALEFCKDSNRNSDWKSNQLCLLSLFGKYVSKILKEAARNHQITFLSWCR